MTLNKAELKGATERVLKKDGELAAADYLIEHVFGDDLDKSGNLSVGHFHRVAANVIEAYRPGALMHDLVENTRKPGKTPWFSEDLEQIGFCIEPTVNIVRFMTKGPDELHFDAVRRLSVHRPSIFVKLEDGDDNKFPSRLKFLKDPALILERAERYTLQNMFLRDVLGGRAKPKEDFGNWMMRQPLELQNWELVDRESSSTVRPRPSRIVLATAIPAELASRATGSLRR